MKKGVLISLLLCFSHVAFAFEEYTYLVVWSKDGNSVAYHLNDTPKILFSNNSLVIETKQIEVSYSLHNYSKFTFENEIPTNIVCISNDNNQSGIFDDNCLVFPKQKAGTKVCIYSFSGIKMMEEAIREEGSSFYPIATLPKGGYVVSVGKMSYKLFVR